MHLLITMSTAHTPQQPQPHPADDPAVALIRAKLATIYEHEPDSEQELEEAESAKQPLSKHQQFVYDLNHSGRSLADIQTAWHTYYAGLSENEKHEVWQEFYKAHEQASHYAQAIRQGAESKANSTEEKKSPQPPDNHASSGDTRSEAEIKQQVLRKVRRQSGKRRKLSRKDHAKSLAFGLGSGLLVIFILMFTFFNEQFITPFITPSTRVSASPIIVDPTNNNVGSAPEIIIPKINVEIPVLYNVSSIDENAMQQGLAESVVHYPTTPSPGELGNGVIFGHSSMNIFNKGKAKFAFLQLRELVEGDTFYLNKNGKQYVYKVISKKVVPPSDVSVLTDTHGKPATFTLITCDPPGLNVNRMIVTGEQISPAPASDQKSTVDTQTAPKPTILPSNSESLWHRFTTWLTN